MQNTYTLVPIGVVRSELKTKDDVPIQGRPHKIMAEIEIYDQYHEAISGLEHERHIYVFTWLFLADRSWLTSYPKNDKSRAAKGVFAIRSASRPNPIGLGLVDLVSVKGRRLQVIGLEAIDKTPVIDIKPFRASIDQP